MKIELVKGVSTYEATKNAFLRIDKDDVNTDYFIVVPDRFSLQAEKLLFDVLNLKSTFNINVVSLTSLADKLLKSKNINYESLSPLEGIMGIKRIMTEHENELVFYKKNTPTFCYEILNNIIQIKSSLLKPEDVIYKGENKILRDKFHDIALIYKLYEEMFNQKVDSSDILDLMAINLDNNTYLKNAVVMFAGFDSFTRSNFAILRACMNNVKKLVISLPASQNYGNSYIYDNDILEKIKDISKSCDVEIEVISPSLILNENQEHLAKNLYSQQKTIKKSNYLHVSSSKTKEDEIKYIADLIKYKIFNGERYRDFSVATSDLSKYQEIIEEVFLSRNIPFYIDSSENVSKSLILALLNKVFDLKKKNFLNEDLLYLVSNPLLNFENREDLITFINERGIFGRTGVFNYLKNDLKEIIDFVLKLDGCVYFQDYTKIIREFLAFIKDNFEGYIIMLEDKKLLKEASIQRQVPEKIENILQVFDKNNQQISFDDFVSFVNIAFSLYQVSALPSFADAVFVGDMTSSFFSEVKNLIVVGASSGNLPLAMSDTGLISDKDIQRLNFKHKIEPSIKMINRRNRFKLFNNLLLAKENLFISFYTSSQDGKQTDKALFVKELENIFNKKAFNTDDISNFVADQGFERFLFTLGGDKKQAQIKLLEYIKDLQIPNDFVSSLNSYLKVDFEKFNVNHEKIETENNFNLFFPYKSFSVSQIERFFDCPFKHFVDYGLRLTQKISTKLERNEIGSFYHEILEKFVKKHTNLKEVKDEDIYKFLNENFERTLNLEKIEFLEEKEIVLKALYKECFKICKRAVKENKYSYYKPLQEEFKISKSYAFDEGNLALRGKVDRIDVYKDKFRIIDYKTGNISRSIFKDLYYGKKIQLLLYSKIVKESLALSLGGVYYFNARSDYENDLGYILEGVTLEGDENFIDTRFFDSEFKKSDIFSSKRTKSGISSNSANEKEFEKLENYALDLSIDSINKIKEGFIRPMPDTRSCVYCKYRGICMYNQKDGTRRYSSLTKDDLTKEVDYGKQGI